MEVDRLILRIPKSYKFGLERKARAQGESVAVIVRGLIRVDLQRDGYLPADPTPTPQAQPATLGHIPTNDKKSPWGSGSFYVVALVAILALLAIISTNVHGTDLLIVIIGSLLFIVVIGALQLRQDEGLSEVNFLKLMIESLKRMPLLRGSDLSANAPKRKRKPKSG